MVRTTDTLNGQRFCNADAPYIVWVVRDVLTDGVAMPHVRMQRAGDPLTFKTVSLSALHDPRLYRPVEGTSEGPRAA